DGVVALFLDVFEEAMLPVHYPALADPEEHADGVVSITGLADHVRVPGADHLDGRRGIDLVQPAERIAKVLGALEVLPRARVLHHGAEPGPDIDGAAPEEPPAIT